MGRGLAPLQVRGGEARTRRAVRPVLEGSRLRRHMYLWLAVCPSPPAYCSNPSAGLAPPAISSPRGGVADDNMSGAWVPSSPVSSVPTLICPATPDTGGDLCHDPIQIPPRGTSCSTSWPCSGRLEGFIRFRKIPSNVVRRGCRCVAHKHLPLPETLPRSLGGLGLAGGPDDDEEQPDGGRDQGPKGSKAKREAEQVRPSLEAYVCAP